MKINKKQFKERLANVLKSISKEATTKLSLLEAFGTFIFTGFFLVLFTIGFNGVANNLFDGLFEILVVLLLLFIAFNSLRIRLSNGYLGWGVIIYLAFGIMSGISGEFSIFELGTNVLRWIIAITIVSLIYEWIVKGRKK